MASFVQLSRSAPLFLSLSTLLTVLSGASGAAAAKLSPPPPQIPAVTKTRIDAALAKLRAAQAGLASSQPELAKHWAAADSAFKQFRGAPKTASPATLTAALNTAQSEYTVALAQVAA